MGGVTNIRRHLDEYGPHGLDVRVAGLCDVGEERWVRRGLERAGFGSDLDRAAMERLGFFLCHADLEDELIRSLGTDTVVRIVEAEGELRSLRTMQQQPAQQGRPLDAQLRRFMGTRGGRKIHYATAFVDALDLGRVPGRSMPCSLSRRELGGPPTGSPRRLERYLGSSAARVGRQPARPKASPRSLARPGRGAVASSSST